MKDMLVIVHVYRNGKNVGQQTRSSVDENVNHMCCDGKVSVVISGHCMAAGDHFQ